MGWVLWQQVRSCPSFPWLSGSTWEQGGWRAPSLQTLAMLCSVRPIKTCLLEPRQPEKAMSAQDMAHPHVLGRTKHLSNSPRGLSPHGCPRAMWGVPRTKESISDELTANVAGCKRDCKSEASQGQAQWSWEHKAGVQTANVICRTLQILGNEEMIVYCFILWSSHITNNGRELQHRIKPVRVCFWVINKNKTLKIIWRNVKKTSPHVWKGNVSACYLSSSLICK